MLVIPVECCIRGNHRRGSLSDSLLVRAAFPANFLRDSPCAKFPRRFVEFHRSNADATQTSIGGRKLDVKGLPRLCVEKYWRIAYTGATLQIGRNCIVYQ